MSAPAFTPPIDCGREAPQPYCMCLACTAARRIAAAAPELYEALREMLTAFSLETEYRGPEAAAMARLAAKKRARAALAKAVA